VDDARQRGADEGSLDAAASARKPLVRRRALNGPPPAAINDAWMKVADVHVRRRLQPVRKKATSLIKTSSCNSVRFSHYVGLSPFLFAMDRSTQSIWLMP
jgi:hypothetical protein